MKAKIDLACGEIESAFFYTVTVRCLETLEPQCLDVVSGSNLKQEHQSFASMNGHGVNHPHMRRLRRQNKTKKRAEVLITEEAETRRMKSDAGIFLCKARCPTLLHYCSLEFLTEKNRDKHVVSGKHKYQHGISSVDKAIKLASNDGGLLMVGTRKDRKKTADATLKSFPSVVDAGAMTGATDAACFNAFHRKEGIDPYQKPAKLQAELDRIFAMRPKRSAEQARNIMKHAIDPVDGGLMFCYAKRGEFMAKSRPEYATWVCGICGFKPCE